MHFVRWTRDYVFGSLFGASLGFKVEWLGDKLALHRFNGNEGDVDKC